jgi:hypothetical protein
MRTCFANHVIEFPPMRQDRGLGSLRYQIPYKKRSPEARTLADLLRDVRDHAGNRGARLYHMAEDVHGVHNVHEA